MSWYEFQDFDELKPWKAWDDLDNSDDDVDFNEKWRNKAMMTAESDSDFSDTDEFSDKSSSYGAEALDPDGSKSDESESSSDSEDPSSESCSSEDSDSAGACEEEREARRDAWDEEIRHRRYTNFLEQEKLAKFLKNATKRRDPAKFPHSPYPFKLLQDIRDAGADLARPEPDAPKEDVSSRPDDGYYEIERKTRLYSEQLNTLVIIIDCNRPSRRHMTEEERDAYRRRIKEINHEEDRIDDWIEMAGKVRKAAHQHDSLRDLEADYFPGERRVDTLAELMKARTVRPLPHPPPTQAQIDSVKSKPVKLVIPPKTKKERKKWKVQECCPPGMVTLASPYPFALSSQTQLIYENRGEEHMGHIEHELEDTVGMLEAKIRKHLATLKEVPISSKSRQCKIKREVNRLTKYLQELDKTVRSLVKRAVLEASDQPADAQRATPGHGMQEAANQPVLLPRAALGLALIDGREVQRLEDSLGVQAEIETSPVTSAEIKNTEPLLPTAEAKTLKRKSLASEQPEAKKLKTAASSSTKTDLSDDTDATTTLGQSGFVAFKKRRRMWK